MMWDEGLGAGDPETHIGQLTNALLRDVRFLSAIGLHTKGMTVAESERMFREEAFQGEAVSRQQAARGTFDPQYLSYTMGKLMIRKLRDDWTATRGGKAAWKQFHDQFLSYGSPPIPLVRRAMMGSGTSRSAVLSEASSDPDWRVPLARWLAPLLLGIVAFALVLEITEPPSPGLDPDALAYLGSAESFARHGEFRAPTAHWSSRDSTSALSHFPTGIRHGHRAPGAIGDGRRCRAHDSSQAIRRVRDRHDARPARRRSDGAARRHPARRPRCSRCRRCTRSTSRC